MAKEISEVSLVIFHLNSSRIGGLCLNILHFSRAYRKESRAVVSEGRGCKSPFGVNLSPKKFFDLFPLLDMWHVAPSCCKYSSISIWSCNRFAYSWEMHVCWWSCRRGSNQLCRYVTEHPPSNFWCQRLNFSRKARVHVAASLPKTRILWFGVSWQVNQTSETIQIWEHLIFVWTCSLKLITCASQLILFLLES
jgi:hypothetical protein